MLVCSLKSLYTIETPMKYMIITDCEIALLLYLGTLILATNFPTKSCKALTKEFAAFYPPTKYSNFYYVRNL